MLLPRRSFLLGAGSLILSPSIVRADSLMKLSGYNMDPWVIAFRYKFGNRLVTSCCHLPAGGIFPYGTRYTIHQLISHMNRDTMYQTMYQIVRHSETVTDNW